MAEVRALVDGELLEGVLCPTCGALIFEEDKHMAWHDRLTSLAERVLLIDGSTS